MTHNPVVSVIVPTYNRPQMLPGAIESILRQTYQDFEIIVINDGGVDVQQIIDSYKDKRIHYINHFTNKGLPAARNSGIMIAHGKYMAYLDDDDIYYPNHLKVLIEFLTRSSYKVAYTDSYRVILRKSGNEYMTIKKDIPYSQDFDFKALLVENFIPVLNVMHERACLDVVGFFDEKLLRLEDWDMWIRLAEKFEMKHIKEITSEFRIRDEEDHRSSPERHNVWVLSQAKIYYKTRKIAINYPEILNHQKAFCRYAIKVKIKELIKKIMNLALPKSARS